MNLISLCWLVPCSAEWGGAARSGQSKGAREERIESSLGYLSHTIEGWADISLIL